MGEALGACAVTVTEIAFQSCIAPSCGRRYAVDEVRLKCEDCGHLLDVEYDWDRLEIPRELSDFDTMQPSPSDPRRRSGVWRYHSLLPFAPLEKVVTIGEGHTLLQSADRVARYVGIQAGRLHLQYEGMNPSGSFKDNGMAAAFTARSRSEKPPALGPEANAPQKHLFLARATHDVTLWHYTLDAESNALPQLLRGAAQKQGL